MIWLGVLDIFVRSLTKFWIYTDCYNKLGDCSVYIELLVFPEKKYNKIHSANTRAASISLHHRKIESLIENRRSYKNFVYTFINQVIFIY